jgi:hypothetical protein
VGGNSITKTIIWCKDVIIYETRIEELEQVQNDMAQFLMGKQGSATGGAESGITLVEN